MLTTKIVGIGARTSIGSTALAAAAAIRAGIAAFVEHPFMIDKHGKPMLVAKDAFLDINLFGPGRLSALAVAAASEALEMIRGRRATSGLDVIIGVPENRPGLPASFENSIAETMQAEFGGLVTINDISFQKSGHTAGFLAAREAARRIANDSGRLTLVGGVDSYLEPETLEWLDEENKLLSDANPWGIIPGEAAGFLLLCSGAYADRYHLRVLGELVTVAHRSEVSLSKDEPSLGIKLTEAVFEALEFVPADEKIANIITDLNGETWRADEFAYTAVRTGDRFVDAAAFLTPADCWGDVGAASGALFVNTAVLAGIKGYANSRFAILQSCSPSGGRTVAILKQV